MTGHPNRLWTPAEDDIIRANHHLQQSQLVALLPGRSVVSCNSRRHKLRRELSPQPAPATVQPIKVRLADYAGMSFTALLMGDPSPMRSALTQKQQGGQQ